MTTISERPAAVDATVGARLGPVVLGTDGSSDAELAFRAAADIARGARIAVHVVSAWSLPAPPTPYGGYVLPEGCAETLERGAQELVDAQAARLRGAGAPLATRHVVSGRAAEAILDLGDEVAAGLIIVGSRGLGPLARLVMGSVSEEVVHNSHRPVLVVRGGPKAWPPARIVAGDDGSDGAAGAVVAAAALGATLGVPVTVATVIPASSLGIRGTSTEAVLADARIPVKQRVAGLSERAGVPLQTWLGFGDPASTILEECERGVTPCLIAVGSRGLGAIARMRYGSVSSKILRAAHSPVLVVPAPAHR